MSSAYELINLGSAGLWTFSSALSCYYGVRAFRSSGARTSGWFLLAMALFFLTGMAGVVVPVPSEPFLAVRQAVLRVMASIAVFCIARLVAVAIARRNP